MSLRPLGGSHLAGGLQGSEQCKLMARIPGRLSLVGDYMKRGSLKYTRTDSSNPPRENIGSRGLEAASVLGLPPGMESVLSPFP